MRDTLYEESATCANARKESKIYTAFHVVSILFLVLAAVHAFMSVNYVGGILSSEVEGMAKAVLLVEWFSVLAVFVGIFFIFFFLKRRFNLSYDYTFVEDELRISKVFNGKRRKLMRIFKADQILKIGMCDKPSFERTTAGMSKKSIVAFTPNREPMEGKTFYYLLYTTSLGKEVFILEARQELLEYLVRAAGMNKFERQ